MLQRILGHTTPTMTQRYVHLSDMDTKQSHRLSSPVERWGIGETKLRKQSGKKKRLR